jgi:hypothetical protein
VGRAGKIPQVEASATHQNFDCHFLLEEYRLGWGILEKHMPKVLR